VSASGLWRHPEFLKLWSAFSISRLGSQITILALPLTAVLVLGAGATETGLLVAARTLGFAIPGPLLGVWVDRHRRFPMLLGANIASALLIGSVPVAGALGSLTMGQLYLVSYLAGISAQVTDLARQSIMTTVVGRDRLVGANSQMQASNAVTQIAGPSIGGALVQASARRSRWPSTRRRSSSRRRCSPRCGCARPCIRAARARASGTRSSRGSASCVRRTCSCARWSRSRLRTSSGSR
jgi:MFS family permease